MVEPAYETQYEVQSFDHSARRPRWARRVRRWTMEDALHWAEMHQRIGHENGQRADWRILTIEIRTTVLDTRLLPTTTEVTR